MAKSAKHRVKPRAPLSRERVLRAAITLADRDGVDSLSMRKLGQALGVEAMSLYRHVANRDGILDGICDMVVGEIEVPAQDADWKRAMRQRAISAHEVVLRHPWASTLIESRTGLSPARLRYTNAIIGSLRKGGFSIAAAYHAVIILDSYIYGFALQEVSWPVSAEESPAATQRMLIQVPAELYPNLTEVTT
jgi:AcrR family transcriptional regulator